MKCTKCGEPLAEGAVYCTECGTSVEQEVNETVVNETPANNYVPPVNNQVPPTNPVPPYAQMNSH